MSRYFCSLAPPPISPPPSPLSLFPCRPAIQARRPPRRARAARLSEPESASCSAGAACPALGGESVCPPGGLPPAPCQGHWQTLVGRRLRRGLVCCSWRGGGCGPAGSARRRGPAWPETVNRVCGPRKALRPTDRIRAKICAHTQIYARVRSLILALSTADTARSESPAGHRPLRSGAADAACCADLAPGSDLDSVRSRSGLS